MQQDTLGEARIGGKEGMREKKGKASFILKVQDNMSDERGKRTRGIDRKATRTGVKKKERKKIVKRRNGGKTKTKKK